MSEDQKIELSADEEKKESLSQEDKMVLELAKMNKKLAMSYVDKAVAQNENAELHYKYIVLQIYMKYGLTPSDSIDESGNINRNASNLVSDS